MSREREFPDTSIVEGRRVDKSSLLTSMRDTQRLLFPLFNFYIFIKDLLGKFIKHYLLIC